MSIRKTIIALTTVALLGVSQLAAANDVAGHMDTLAENYGLVLKADSPQSMAQGLQAMRVAVQAAQQGIPSKLEGKSPDSPEVQDYRHGLMLLLGQIDQAIALAEEGKLTEAKALAQEFKQTRDTYHKKYR